MLLLRSQLDAAQEASGFMELQLSQARLEKAAMEKVMPVALCVHRVSLLDAGTNISPRAELGEERGPREGAEGAAGREGPTARAV